MKSLIKTFLARWRNKKSFPSLSKAYENNYGAAADGFITQYLVYPRASVSTRQKSKSLRKPTTDSENPAAFSESGKRVLTRQLIFNHDY